jgi:small redox-active disulfide protein 2
MRAAPSGASTTPGCKRCEALAAATRTAVASLGLDANVVKVSHYREVARMGVMSTPALAIDGRLAISGPVPSVEQLKELFAAAADDRRPALRAQAQAPRRRALHLLAGCARA